jgi:hypothetical protein
VSFVEVMRGITRGGHRRRSPRVPKEMTDMFTIEEDSGTYTGSLRRHNGYYAGDFTRTPMRTASELSALARLQPPSFPIASGNGD